MKRLILAAAAALLVSTVVSTPAFADVYNKKTIITVNKEILIPGRTLAPGKYVMKLASSSSNRNIVQIFNENEDKLQATILAINNYRLIPTDKTELDYWETPAGVPPALRAWFFPGDNYGQEFAYPKKMADQIAQANKNATIPTYSDNAFPNGVSESSAKSAQIDNEPEPQPATSSLKQPAPKPVEQTQTNQKSTTVIAQAPRNQNSNPVSQGNNTAQVSPAQNEAPRNLTAQAQPNQQGAQPNPNGFQRPSELPETGSDLGLMLLIGCACLATAAGIRYARSWGGRKSAIVVEMPSREV